MMRIVAGLAGLLLASGVSAQIVTTADDPAEIRHTLSEAQRQADTARQRAERLEASASSTRAAADKTLQTVIRPEIEQAVQHERQSRASAAEAALIEINLGALVGRFGLQTETAEIITDIGVEIITLMIIDIGEVTDQTRTREIEVLIFDQQHAGISADVPAIVTRQGRTGQGTRRKRSREGKLPHLDSPFKSVTKDC